MQSKLPIGLVLDKDAWQALCRCERISRYIGCNSQCQGRREGISEPAVVSAGSMTCFETAKHYLAGFPCPQALITGNHGEPAPAPQSVQNKGKGDSGFNLSS